MQPLLSALRVFDGFAAAPVVQVPEVVEAVVIVDDPLDLCTVFWDPFGPPFYGLREQSSKATAGSRVVIDVPLTRVVDTKDLLEGESLPRTRKTTRLVAQWSRESPPDCLGEIWIDLHCRPMTSSSTHGVMNGYDGRMAPRP